MTTRLQDVGRGGLLPFPYILYIPFYRFFKAFCTYCKRTSVASTKIYLSAMTKIENWLDIFLVTILLIPLFQPTTTTSTKKKKESQDAAGAAALLVLASDCCCCWWWWWLRQCHNGNVNNNKNKNHHTYPTRFGSHFLVSQARHAIRMVGIAIRRRRQERQQH